MNLNHITVPTLNLSRSISFYEKLGLKIIVVSLPYYARFECTEGDATFSIHLVDTLHEGNGIILYFESAKLDETVQGLKEKGIVFDQDPIDQNWLWREAKLRDPDGNQIILYHAGQNRKNPPWRIIF